MAVRDFTVKVSGTVAYDDQSHGSFEATGKWTGQFGGLTALTKGLFFKKINDSAFSLGNYIQNQDFKDTGGAVEYTDKAPAGTNATNIVYDITEVFGQVIRLHPTLNDMVIGIVRDKIDAGEGMAKMTASLIGHYTEGEA